MTLEEYSNVQFTSGMTAVVKDGNTEFTINIAAVDFEDQTIECPDGRIYGLNGIVQIIE